MPPLCFGDVASDFAAADRVIRRKMRWPRSGGQPMETVGAIAEFDEVFGEGAAEEALRTAGRLGERD